MNEKIREAIKAIKEKLGFDLGPAVEINSWCGDTESGFYTEYDIDMDALNVEIDRFQAKLAARATPAQPVSAKTYQQRADDAGLTIRTKESLFDYAIAEITDLRAICKHDAAEQDDIAKRLRRVAKAAGVPVDGDDSFVYGAAFALLGQIASALESKPSPSSVGDAIRAMSLPEPKVGDELLNSWESECFARGALAMRSTIIPMVEQTNEWRDFERMNMLQAETVDTIYLDDGRIIDVGGKHAGDLRKAIDAFAAPSIAQDGQGGNHG